MGPGLETWLWVAGGAVLLGSEFVTPHLVSGFLGAGALVVAGLRVAGVVEGTWASVGVWAVVSAALLALLRSSLAKFAGPGQTSRASVSEDVRLYGSIVDVVEAVGDEDAPGRVRVDGTSWPATSRNGPLAAGSKARLLHRENLAWVVEPAGPDDAPLVLPPPKEDKP